MNERNYQQLKKSFKMSQLKLILLRRSWFVVKHAWRVHIPTKQNSDYRKVVFWVRNLSKPFESWKINHSRPELSLKLGKSTMRCFKRFVAMDSRSVSGFRSPSASDLLVRFWSAFDIYFEGFSNSISTLNGLINPFCDFKRLVTFKTDELTFKINFLAQENTTLRHLSGKIWAHFDFCTFTTFTLTWVLQHLLNSSQAKRIFKNHISV